MAFQSFQNRLSSIFLAHPKSVGETYLQHFAVAFSFALIFGRLMVMAGIHAIFPNLFETSVSDRIIAMADDMRARRTGG